MANADQKVYVVRNEILDSHVMMVSITIDNNRQMFVGIPMDPTYYAEYILVIDKEILGFIPDDI